MLAMSPRWGFSSNICNLMLAMSLICRSNNPRQVYFYKYGNVRFHEVFSTHLKYLVQSRQTTDDRLNI